MSTKVWYKIQPSNKYYIASMLIYILIFTLKLVVIMQYYHDINVRKKDKGMYLWVKDQNVVL